MRTSSVMRNVFFSFSFKRDPSNDTIRVEYYSLIVPRETLVISSSSVETSSFFFLLNYIEISYISVRSSTFKFLNLSSN